MKGLKDLNLSVKRIREVVRYIRNSPSRLQKFKEFSNLIGIESKTTLCLDIAIRWKTYLMLKAACEFEILLKKYEENESSF